MTNGEFGALKAVTDRNSVDIKELRTDVKYITSQVNRFVGTILTIKWLLGGGIATALAIYIFEKTAGG